MPDYNAIYHFAEDYLKLYQSDTTKQFELEDGFGDKCFALDFEMDAGESFKRAFPELDALYKNDHLKQIIHRVNDVMLLGNAIFSKWRAITHWDYIGDLLSAENREWFIIVFTRLLELSSVIPEAGLYSAEFKGTLQKLRLISDGLCYGPMPEPDAEVEQHLTVCRDGRVWFSGYDYGYGFPYVRNRKAQFKIEKEKAATICDAFQQYFSAMREIYFVTDVGNWELKLTNDEKENFYYSGSMYAKFSVNGKDLSDILRENLDIENLWGFHEEYLEEEPEYLYCRVIFGEGQKSYYYIADDESICKGDFVVVPAGKGDRFEVAKVVSAKWYPESKVPFPEEETKHIFRRCVAEDIALLWEKCKK